MAEEAQRSEAVFVISVAAELTGVHPQTLRIYERRGLIEPYRTPGGTRRYSRADLERLELILALTEAGLNLEGVKRVLKLEEEIEELRDDVAEMKHRVEEMAEEAERKVREVHRSYRREIVLHSRSQSRARHDD
ncbi:MAG TPA: MerR family transcriptional regulator [Acidimicrobiia bacterium]|jgi:MerR family transcriptional regulator/heat shock protein HspR|nr:MerR family transcriptional regulator [Acidimicrobiia bacterium]